MSRLFIFRIFACLFAAAAIFHLVNLFYKLDQSPAWRHILFFIIGIFCAYGFLARPKYFLFLFIILLIQQFYSHGSSLINSWTYEHTINWISGGVLITLLLALIFLIQDYKAP